jgi:hypothetical protein
MRVLEWICRRPLDQALRRANLSRGHVIVVYIRRIQPGRRVNTKNTKTKSENISEKSKGKQRMKSANKKSKNMPEKVVLDKTVP